MILNEAGRGSGSCPAKRRPFGGGGTMRLTLTGMSGSGKSHWSGQLARHGFTHICCDDLIAERLAPRLTGDGDAIARLGLWMGFPFQPGYEEREAEYLRLEKEMMAESLGLLGGPPGTIPEDIVMDATGSVIYTGGEILAELRRLTTIVHLETPVEVQRQMLESYLSSPRPVLWRGMFVREPSETNEEALARCYHALLAGRERLYREFADVTVDYATHRQQRLGVREFLDEIERAAAGKARSGAG